MFNYANIVLAANADNITAFVTADDFFNFTAATYGGSFASGAGAVGGIITATAGQDLITGGIASSANDLLITGTLADIQALDFATGDIASGRVLAYATDTNQLVASNADGDFTGGVDEIIGTVTTLTGVFATTNFVGV